MLKKSLALRVLLASFLLIALPLVIYSFIFFQKLYQESLVRSYESLLQAATYRTYTLKEAAYLPSGFVTELAYALDVDNKIKELPNVEFNKNIRTLLNFPQDIDVFVTAPGVDGKYKIIASNLELMMGKVLLSYTRMGIVLGKGVGSFMRIVFAEQWSRLVPYMYSSVVIPHKANPKDVLGFLLVANNISDYIQEALQPISQNGQPFAFALTQQDGLIQAASDPQLVGQIISEISKERQAQLLEEMHLAAGPPFFTSPPLEISRLTALSQYFEFSWQKEMQLATIASAPEIGYSFISFTSKAGVFHKTMKQFTVIYITLAAILIIGGGTAFWLSRWMSEPLRQLVNLMKNVREGKLQERFQEKPFGFEINLLGNMFNQTLSSLLENMQRTEDERVKKETFKREIQVAEKVQMAIFPISIPHVGGLEIAADYIPAVVVGGDFYYIFRKDNKVILFCADAAGSGISTCLYSLGVRSLLRVYSALYDDVGKVMAMANNSFCEDTGDSGMFISAIMCSYNLDTKILSYYSCGHVAGIIRKKEGHIITLKRSGMAMGLAISEAYQEAHVELESGDMLLLHTDGLVEVENEKHQHFTEQKIINFLQQRKWETAQEVVDGLKQEVLLFTKNMDIQEDVSLVAMRIQ